MSFQDYARALDPELGKTSEHQIDMGEGRILHTRFRGAGKADCLIVHFHGAVDRKTRPIPVFANFQPDFNGKSHQLSLADPTLQNSEDLELAWYVGAEGFPVQSLLKEYLTAVIQHLGISRIIFFGSSGGGFSALYYGWNFSNCIVLACSPQTRITSYYQRHQTRFKELCWPSAESLGTLPDDAVTDICKLYAKGHQNTVVCLVSQGDTFHLNNHVLPLISTLSSHSKQDFVLECGYWGIPNHSRSVTPAAFIPWLMACVTAPSTKALDLISHHSTLLQARALQATHNIGQQAGSGTLTGSKVVENRGFDEGDLQFAALLQKLQLQT